MWMGFIQQVDYFKNKTEISWGRNNSSLRLQHRKPAYLSFQSALQTSNLPAPVIRQNYTISWMALYLPLISLGAYRVSLIIAAKTNMNIYN